MQKTLIVTGGAGFIGSHVVRQFISTYPDYRIINIDKLTYAGNLENLKDLENQKNYASQHTVSSVILISILILRGLHLGPCLIEITRR